MWWTLTRTPTGTPCSVTPSPADCTRRTPSRWQWRGGVPHIGKEKRG
nr:MAG TPA: hypothetical protein [Caudoviricetes sp.]